jgi:uncharacterized membrane protein
MVILLGMFSARIAALQQFYIVAYALGIVFLVQCAQFWSPINDPALFTTTARTHHSTENVEPGSTTSTSSTTRRYPEFQAWVVSTRYVALATCCTLFSMFDVPVYAPILWAYLIVLCVVRMIQTIKQRREASRNPDDGTATTASTGTVQISLQFDIQVQYYAICSVTPWSALRSPPSSLRISQGQWRDFLGDLEGAMIDTNDPRSLVFSSCGKVLAVVYICNFMLFDVLYQSPYVPCDPHQGCYRFLWIGAVSNIPLFVYMLIVLRSFHELNTQRVARCLENLEQVFAAMREEHPHIVVKVKSSRWEGLPVVVEVSPAVAATTTTTIAPNPKTGDTDPLLAQIA